MGCPHVMVNEGCTKNKEIISPLVISYKLGITSAT
jgi:hypothetical protein